MLFIIMIQSRAADIFNNIQKVCILRVVCIVLVLLLSLMPSHMNLSWTAYSKSLKLNALS